MIAVRSATVADANRCAEIYAPFVTDSWVSFALDAPDSEQMSGHIAGILQSHDWLVAEREGAVLGYVYGSEHRTRAAYQTSCDVAVYVDSAYKRQGIGRLLYEALLPRLKDRNIHAAFAGIALPNQASIALHQALGFDLVGTYREVGWKMGSWRDVTWFQRLL
tara:strand:+ start:295 stop:783 length:489 start_codon:yes stop_codon:yes gene_type:complete